VPTVDAAPVDTAQRRARLARRHHLAPPEAESDPARVAADLIALHASDPATVHLSVAVRSAHAPREALEHALYTERRLVRLLGMRRTVFVVPVGLAGVIQAGAATTIAARERRKLLALITAGELTDGLDPARWLAEVQESVLAELARRGEALAGQLSAAEPRLARKITLAPGKSYAASQAVAGRVLFQLAAEGRIVRGRPRGSWISGQHHWTLPGPWLTGGEPGAGEPAIEDAQRELARHWLRRYGPGTRADLRWWTGWTAREVDRALAGLDLARVALPGGASGLLLAEDVEPVVEPGPWVALLPALDPTMMGWAHRDWYLGPHGPALFDRTGNPGPTVWCDGRVVGGWAQRADGTVVHRLLEDIGTAAAEAVAAAAASMRDWLGAARVTPRFRTPLERELVT
jgi:hypothetical protein